MTLTLFIFSLTSALLSGALALFAPCCITFLLPSYFASVFQARQKIIAMTGIFFIGLATILVPISLGVAWLSSFFSNYHQTVFTIGGILLITYGIMAFFGKTVMFPLRWQPNLDQPANVVGVFTLGMFSGIASSCCAPVLAGMLTLTAMAASLPLALFISLTYVLGMTIPLFVLALIWDKKQIGQSKIFRGRAIKFKIGNWKHVVHSTHLLVSLLFIVTGAFVLYTATHGEAASASPWQSRISAMIQAPIHSAAQATASHPAVSLGAYFLLFVLIYIFFSRTKPTTKEQK